jgi:hypothetical protein
MLTTSRLRKAKEGSDRTSTIIERVEKILADPTAPDLPRLETEIERLVYALYNLTEEEIAVVEGRK